MPASAKKRRRSVVAVQQETESEDESEQPVVSGKPDKSGGAARRQQTTTVNHTTGAAVEIVEDEESVHLRRGNDDVEDLAEQRRREKEERRLRREERKASKPGARKKAATAGVPSAAERAAAEPEAPAESKQSARLRARWAEPPEQLWAPDLEDSTAEAFHRRGELAPPQLEVARCGRFSKLRVWFKDQCLKAGLRKPPFGETLARLAAAIPPNLTTPSGSKPLTPRTMSARCPRRGVRAVAFLLDAGVWGGRPRRADAGVGVEAGGERGGRGGLGPAEGTGGRPERHRRQGGRR